MKWTLQESPKMLDAHGPKGVVMNIYGKYYVVTYLIENAMELME